MNCDELFRFEETEGGYYLAEYLQKKNENVTKVVVPSEHNGLPVLEIGRSAFIRAFFLCRVTISEGVTAIGDDAFTLMCDLERVDIPSSVSDIRKFAFFMCESLREVTLPKELKAVGKCAFCGCSKLERVTFLNPNTAVSRGMFLNCPGICAENALMSLLGSFDLTAAFPEKMFRELPADIFRQKKSPSIRTLDDDATIFREDVFALAVKNRCFREATSAELLRLLNLVIKRDQGEIIHIAAEGGLLSDREMTAELIDIAAANKKTEIAAWLLDYQNRIFGSIGGTDYEL